MITKTLKYYSARKITAKDYIRKGAECRNKNFYRSENPYSYKTFKYKLWDLGWCNFLNIDKAVKETLHIKI